MVSSPGIRGHSREQVRAGSVLRDLITVNDQDTDRLFADLYERYYRAVFSYFVRHGFSREDARDLAQTTFFRVYRTMEGYRGDAEWSYLVETAKRVRLNEFRYRRAEKRKVEITSLDAMEHLPSVAHLNPASEERPASPLEEVLKRETTRELREAIAELSPEDRRYFKMWFQGRRYGEIAIAMQVTMDAVKARLYRIRKHLREVLKEKLGDPEPEWP
jgi:RNA polymerase sigma-70 factor (ECF subfamily)